jgi:hypothetical protein
VRPTDEPRVYIRAHLPISVWRMCVPGLNRKETPLTGASGLTLSFRRLLSQSEANGPIPKRISEFYRSL